MYTLEDDQETSASLRKKDFRNPSYTQAVSGVGTGREGAGMGGTGGIGGMEPEDEENEENEVTGTFGAVPTQQPPSSMSLPSLPSHTASLARLLSPKQITSSFKALAVPGPDAKVATSTAGGRRAALLAMLVACIAVFFTAMDQTVVVTVLPKIIADPGINISFTHIDHAAWIISAYLLGFIIAMPLMGRVSDIYGRRRILLLCLFIFGTGSVLCGLAPTFGQNIDLSFLGALGIDTSSPGLIFLIAARFLQAIGGGAVVPVAMAIVSDFYGQEKRGLALGIIGAVTEAGGVVGPLYGALIVEHFDWTYIFYLNAPLVLLLMIGTWFIVPKGKRLSDRIDWLGAVLLGASLTCLSLGLAQQGTELGAPNINGATPQNNPFALLLAVIFLAAFIFVEWKVRHPVVDLSVFRRFTFSASALLSLMVGAALIIAMAGIPLFVDTVLTKEVPSDQLSLVSGLALLRMTAMIPVGAFLGGWLSGRVTPRLTGILGLLFVAAGFFLMSRWPMNVDWTQMTVSTITTGLGFGLVIAPISTTAINSVRPTQAGMGSAIVTALRMTGMIFGLAALTSWALGYFKSLAAQFPSLPTTATADQFAKWSQGYADHLIASAHTVYTTVFFATMFLSLLAIVPAVLLWGNKPAVEEEHIEPDPANEPTGPIPSPEQGDPALSGAFLAGAELFDTVDPSVGPPVPPIIEPTQNGGRRPRRRRRRLLLVGAILLLLLIVGGSIFAIWSNQPDTSGITPPASAGSTPTTGVTTTPTPIPGPRMFEIALNSSALTSIFAAQLGLNQGTLTNMAVAPTPGDGVVITLDLHIDGSGIHRVMPIEIDGVIGLTTQGNVQLQVTHLKRDGLDAGQATAQSMQTALNQLILASVMPGLHATLKTAKLVAVHTSSTVVCGAGMEMLTLLIMAPPVQGLPAQPRPTALCFKSPTDIHKLFQG